MEITIGHDEKGSLRLNAKIRVSSDNNGHAKGILFKILNSIAEDMEILGQMERELETHTREYEIVAEPRPLVTEETG